jgi:hypothetical protein
MRRVSLNFLVDLAAFAAFVFLASSGVLMHYLLPPGTGHSAAIWGFGRHDWGAFHFWISVTFLALLGVHVILHWRWILTMVGGRRSAGEPARSRRVALGAVGLLALLALALAPLLSPVQAVNEAGGGGARGEQGEGGGHGPRGAQGKDSLGQTPHLGTPPGQGEAHAGSEEIRGTLTLLELEQRTGVPAAHVIEKLKLPADLALDNRLGPLHFEYNFEMEDVRRVVADYKSHPKQ